MSANSSLKISQTLGVHDLAPNLRSVTRSSVCTSEKEWPRVGDNVDRSYRGKGLQLEFTVEDNGVFTMPWSATITYLKAQRTDWEERICAENVGHYYEAHYFSDKDAHIPTADKPDF